MKVIPKPNSDRFSIADDDGKIIDDADGYGYKTKQKAHKAMWYRFQGGKEKLRSREQGKRRFFSEHKGLEKFIGKIYENSFKELFTGEYTEQDILDEIKEQFGVDMPKEFLHD